MDNTFKNWLENQERKVLILMRGISGSGKSTKAKQLASGGPIFSTDDFFYDTDGKYNFDRTRLGEFHQKNKERAEQAMQQGVSPVVIDNTNTQFFEMRAYVQLAQKYGYEVEFHEPDTSWKFDAEELSRRNQHGTPPEVIKSMVSRWQHNPTVDAILQSKAPWEK
jgi:predicted kinase